MKSHTIASSLMIVSTVILGTGCSSSLEERVSGAPAPSDFAPSTLEPDERINPVSRLKGRPSEIFVVDGKEYFVSVPESRISFAQRESAEFNPFLEADEQFLRADEIVARYKLQASKPVAPLELALGTMSDSVLSAPAADGKISLVLQERPVWILVEAGLLIADEFPESTDPPVESTTVRVIDAATGDPILEFTDPTNRVVA